MEDRAPYYRKPKYIDLYIPDQIELTKKKGTYTKSLYRGKRQVLNVSTLVVSIDQEYR